MVNTIIKEDAVNLYVNNPDIFSRMAGKTILITGASGFLCGYLVDALYVINQKHLSKPIKIIAIDNYLRGLPDRFKHLSNDKNIIIEKFDVIKPYKPKCDIDFIVHGASIASPTYYRQFPIETIDVNVVGLKNMLELAQADCESVIFLSSSEIYGDPTPENIPTPESYRGLVSCTGPRACYDESKRLGETMCVVYHSKRNVPVKMVRPFNVYGPMQRLDDKRIVPDLLNSVMNGQDIVLFSDGLATRSFCYASDFIAGMLRVMLDGENGEPYNIGADEEISIKQAAVIASKCSNPQLRIDYKTSDDKDYLADNPQRRCPDLSKVKKIGYEPNINFSDGFQRTLTSYST